MAPIPGIPIKLAVPSSGNCTPPSLVTGRTKTTVAHSSFVRPQQTLPPRSRWVPLQHMSMGQLVDCLASCVKVGCRPSPSFLARYSSITQGQMHHLRPKQLSTMLRAIVALDYHPDEEWLEDFDSTCFSHHGPWDTKSSIQVCAAMLALPSTSYTFPQAVYLKILANPTRFDDYIQLAASLYCLGSHNVPLWDEQLFLGAVGTRMGQLLTGMQEGQAQRAVALSMSKTRTLAEVLEVDSLLDSGFLEEC